MNKELQVENGNFTRIINPIIEKLIEIPFKGCELAIALFIIRKTYGFNKTQDEISITQFEKALKRGRPTIVKALKNLILLNIVNTCKLVNTPNKHKITNIYKINKYFETWELVNTCKLVKRCNQDWLMRVRVTSKHVLTHKRHITKDNTKNILQTNVCGEFNSKEYLTRLLVDKNRHVQIIGKYAQTKELTFPTKQAVSDFISRNSRPAKQLVQYSDEQIRTTVEWLISQKWLNDWTLETILRYINENYE